MVKLNEPLIKQLQASGAITTNGKAGVLHKVFVMGDTAGDSVAVLDGATEKIRVLIPTDLIPVTVDFPSGSRPIFTTDIDVTITTSNTVFATFVYEEIAQ